MTRQETFDKVAQHLLRQNARAMGPGAIGPQCVYRAPDGKKCAVGCLIPDDKYNPSMEGRSLVMHGPLQAIVGCENARDMLRLLDALQGCHDDVPVEKWREHLKHIAERHGLDARALDGA